MLNNFIKVTLRSLFRRKGFAIINIAGLSIGISCVIFISLYISSELSFEKHFPFSDRIYRVALNRIYPDRVKNFATSPVMVAPTIAEKINEIESATRLHRLLFQNDIRVEIGERMFKETHFLFADSNFFKVFTFIFTEGSPHHSLHDPTSVILTESTARKYFGKTNVLGEFIKMDNVILKVTGVIKDQPSSTHVQFDLLGSIELHDHLKVATERNDWTLAWVYTYIKLKPGYLSSEVERLIQKTADESGAANIASKFGPSYAKEGHRFNYFLQPLVDIHLTSHLDAEVSPNSNIQFIYLLILVSVIILTITIINFVNLSISKIGERAKEIGIRKTLGSDDKKIRLQIFGESLFVCLLSSLVSCLLVWMLWPEFIDLVGRPISLSQVIQPEHLFYLVLFVFAITLLAGSYPAIIFGSLQPSRVLKGEYKLGRKSIRVRSSLMIIQFSIAIAMIIGSMAVLNQMKYLASKELGFSQENVLVISQAQTLGTNYKPFIDKVRGLTFVENAGGGALTAVPGNFLGSVIFENVENTALSDVRANTTTFGDGFSETLNLKLLDGRNFSEKINDSSSVVINESAVKAFELREPVGARIRNLTDKKEFVVVGVVADYHFFSLHSPISPLVIFRGDPQAAMSAVVMKLKQPISNETINGIKDAWKELSSDPFEYSALQQDIGNLYQSDHATARIFNIFTILAMMLSCIGMLGLTSNLAQQRLKEMCIRRVLGATQLEVASTFAGPFIKMTLYSFGIALASSFWLITQWLNSYPYHEALSLQTYFGAIVLSSSILIISLSAQFAKLINPDAVKLLKDN